MANVLNNSISASQQPPSTANAPSAVTTVEIECKKICTIRCLYAVAWGVAMQFVLLAMFLLFVNFSILHPLTWITSTFWLIFSIYTWLWIMPLISTVIVYGVYLGKIYLNQRQVYRTRFVTIYKRTLPASMFLALHGAIGFLTTWLYSKFLSTDYQSLLLNESECTSDEWISNSVCLNEKYLLLSLYGVSAAIWYCWKKDPSKEPCEFPIIHQSKYLRVRAFVYSQLRSILLRAFIPVATTFVAYNFIGRIPLLWILSKLFNANLVLNESVHVYDVKLLLFIWILSAHILSNLHLMAFLFQVFLTEPRIFPVEATSLAVQNGNYFAHSTPQTTDVTLVQALANTKVPIVRQLAALDLYTLSEFNDIYNRRQQIYALSIPGGHPYNWNALSAQCLSLINAYNDELLESIKHIKLSLPQIKYNNNQMPNQAQYMKSFSSSLLTSPPTEFRSSTPTWDTPATATEMAEKIRNRQYNDSHGIRNILSPLPPSSNSINGNLSPLSPIKSVADPCARFNRTVELLQQRLQSVKMTILNTPGINYLFGQSETARLHAALTISKTEEIGWVVQGLASIAVHSKKEDLYGVVQINLRDIFDALLQLRETINKIPALGILGTSTVTSPYIRTNTAKANGANVIRNAVKRSLYHLCITFDDCLANLISNPNDLRILQNYIEFLEV